MNDAWVQDEFPLTLRHVLERMRGMYGDAEVVTQRDGGERTRTSNADLGRRVDRLANALRELGVEPGDRVATFAFNTQEHLELYHAVPCFGAILHMVNVRLFDEDLDYIFNHAEDAILFVERSLAERIAPLLDRLPTVRAVVVIGGTEGCGIPDAIDYEELLAAQADHFAYRDLDDRSPAGLCYTSGTTGRPKGVIYTHRSQTLHALAVCAADTVGVSSTDRVLPLVPMFHANAWGLPYAAGMTGSDLLFLGRHTQPTALLSMLEDEQATVAGAVPTIWMDLLRHVDAHGGDLSSLRTVLCGGAAVPRSLMEAWQERHGVRVLQSWGMTETGPLASIARPPRHGDEWSYRDTAGRVAPLVEVRVVAGDGTVQPHDGEATGEVQIRGPWITAGYYREPAPEKFHNGWLRTGDIASVDPRGYIRISDRAKDVIKSGGEWISSVALEHELVAHPAVREAAVIAKPDDRWSERPLACVVLEADATCTADDLHAHLADRVARWWLPDEFAFIAEVPKTSIGKYDKKLLRQELAGGRLAGRTLVGSVTTKAKTPDGPSGRSAPAAARPDRA